MRCLGVLLLLIYVCGDLNRWRLLRFLSEIHRDVLNLKEWNSYLLLLLLLLFPLSLFFFTLFLLFFLLG